jgi:hypothetical protein
MTRRFLCSNRFAPSLRVIFYYYDQATVRSEPDLTSGLRTGITGVSW